MKGVKEGATLMSVFFNDGKWTGHYFNGGTKMTDTKNKLTKKGSRACIRLERGKEEWEGQRLERDISVSKKTTILVSRGEKGQQPVTIAWRQKTKWTMKHVLHFSAGGEGLALFFFTRHKGVKSHTGEGFGFARTTKKQGWGPRENVWGDRNLFYLDCGAE